jgi:hypothetical protein
MSVDGFNGGSLNGVTYRATVHDFPPGSYANTPGLWEGVLAGNFNISDANPRDTAEPTTLAANGWCNQDGSINGKTWLDNTTYVYTGYIWNRTGAPATWTFAEHFDDNVLLIINGTVVLYDMVWGTPSKASYTLKPGPNAFEVRFGQGIGGAGAPDPAGTGTSWWNGFNRATSFAIDFDGRNSEDWTHYTILDPGFVANVNGGPLFTLTANTDPGRVNDLITSTGTIDTTGLKIVPSDLISATPPASSYVIGRAGGGFTGAKPLAEGFSGTNWRAVCRGNDLLLLRPSTEIIIR